MKSYLFKITNIVKKNLVEKYFIKKEFRMK